MENELLIVCDEDGVFREYDDTYDITFHFESAEDRDEFLEKIKTLQEEN